MSAWNSLSRPTLNPTGCSTMLRSIIFRRIVAGISRQPQCCLCAMCHAIFSSSFAVRGMRWHLCQDLFTCGFFLDWACTSILTERAPVRPGKTAFSRRDFRGQRPYKSAPLKIGTLTKTSFRTPGRGADPIRSSPRGDHASSPPGRCRPSRRPKPPTCRRSATQQR